MRLGLCCKFLKQDIKFRDCTAKRLRLFSRAEQLAVLSKICHNNTGSLRQAIDYCAEHNIFCFRINSRILPLKTHPEITYELQELPDGEAIIAAFKDCGKLARQKQMRLSFHPDQFVLLNSPREDVVNNSIKELEYQAMVSELVGADVINIHGGGMYGNNPEALERLARQIDKLPDSVRSRLTLENDDRTYTPSDLLPVCRQTGIPMVYDVHHHRCNPDGMSVEEATSAAQATWNREPLFHISSPREGWNATNPRPHHDYIDPQDFPTCWRNLDITIEIEAKAKELAIAKLQNDLNFF